MTHCLPAWLLRDCNGWAHLSASVHRTTSGRGMHSLVFSSEASASGHSSEHPCTHACMCTAIARHAPSRSRLHVMHAFEPFKLLNPMPMQDPVVDPTCTAVAGCILWQTGQGGLAGRPLPEVVVSLLSLMWKRWGQMEEGRKSAQGRQCVRVSLRHTPCPTAHTLPCCTHPAPLQ